MWRGCVGLHQAVEGPALLVPLCGLLLLVPAVRAMAALLPRALSLMLRAGLRAAAPHEPDLVHVTAIVEGALVAAPTAAGVARAVPTCAGQAGRPHMLFQLAPAWRIVRRAVGLAFESARVGHDCEVICVI